MLVKNIVLYAALVRRFKEVRIANHGADRISYWKPSVYTSSKEEEVVLDAGEQYRVNCPLCGDKRFRLYVSYAYNSCDEFGRRRWAGLLHCFNNRCENRLLPIFDDLLGGFYRGSVKVIQSKQLLENKLEPVNYPGLCYPINSLSSNHIAIEYVTKRGFDPYYLWDRYRVAYCQHADYPDNYATNRLVIPVYQEGRMVAWQARSLVPGERLKYYTKRGSHIGRALFNVDTAKLCKLAVVTEGPFDAMRIGKAGVCVFNKSLTYAQRQLLQKHWSDGALAFMLDGDALEDSVRLASMISSQASLRAFTVPIPNGKDPDDFTHDSLVNLVNYYASKNDIPYRLEL